MRRLVPLALGTVLFLTGCFDIESEIVLNSDLSGTAVLDMTVDSEATLYMMAAMQRQLAGREGEPTEEELEEARRELLAQQEEEEEFDPDEAREALAASLPEGVSLTELAFEQEGLTSKYRIAFRFDHVSRLTEVRLSPPEEEEAGQNPVEKPFGTLRFVDEGDTFVLTSEPVNPARQQMETGQIPPGMEKAFERLMKGLHVAFKIRTPLEVVEHNATRVDGATLVWDYGLETLLGGAEGAPPFIRARFRK